MPQFKNGKRFRTERSGRVLARYYGFTDEEADFIINADIKYRMGQGGGEEDAG